MNKIPPMILKTTQFLLAIFLLTAMTACPGTKQGGWSQGDRDQLINSCVSEAKAKAAQLDEAKLKAYCSCYEQNIEKQFPNVSDLATAKAEDMTKAAESCLPLMFK